jgi:2-polyprenyl-3-methyl-5-hydroxy-6-metoxy-1,4-benzoquinol methylase
MSASASVLLHFKHGLGDVCQLTVILKHLRHFHPDWEVDVKCGRGKHSAIFGLCRRAYHDQEPGPTGTYHSQITLYWYENYNRYSDRPNTKVTNCLQEVFNLPYLPELGRYEIHVPNEAKAKATAYLRSIGCQEKDGKFNAAVFHFQGNTSPEKKNLSHHQAKALVLMARECGRVPVILDWDFRCRLPNGTTIFCPDVTNDLWGAFGSGDAAAIAALISASDLFVGIDSGPGHIASATDTPALICWRGHHPMQFHDPAPNTTHLVRSEQLSPCDDPKVAEWFESHYNFIKYHQNHDLVYEAAKWMNDKMGGGDFQQMPNKMFLSQLSATEYGELYYQEHKDAGLDYLEFGDWHQQYGRWFVESLGLQGKRVLDVGCACGAILRGLGQAGAIVQGIEINEYMIALGREKWPDMSPLLFVCDASNLRIFRDEQWDVIHTAQVAEHWKPELVPPILMEMARVTTKGGLLFCCLDTEELFARQGRVMEREDPTHVCIRPMAWWKDRLAETGWQDCSAEFAGPLRNHGDSFLNRYDWDWFIARKI